jgi:hypothetical protein
MRKTLSTDSPTVSYVGAATSEAEEKCLHGGIGARASLHGGIEPRTHDLKGRQMRVPSYARLRSAGWCCGHEDGASPTTGRLPCGIGAKEPARSAPRIIPLDGLAIDDYAHATHLTPLLMLQSDSPTGSYAAAATSAAEVRCRHGGIGGRAGRCTRNRTQDVGLEGQAESEDPDTPAQIESVVAGVCRGCPSALANFSRRGPQPLRASRLLTVIACHLPPRAVATPRAFSAMAAGPQDRQDVSLRVR